MDTEQLLAMLIKDMKHWSIPALKEAALLSMAWCCPRTEKTSCGGGSCIKPLIGSEQGKRGGIVEKSIDLRKAWKKFLQEQERKYGKKGGKQK